MSHAGTLGNTVNDSTHNLRTRYVDERFSLAITCGPAAWVAHRSPRQSWATGCLTWVGREADQTVWRKVRQVSSGELHVEGSAADYLDQLWLENVLGVATQVPTFHDPVIEELAQRFAGLRPMSDGGLFEGLITAIVGQSVSVAAAAVTQKKLCALFDGGIVIDERLYSPLPTAEQLAAATPETIKRSGVTGKRAEAIVTAARCFLDGELPADDWARANPDETVRMLLELPGVGRWTAESTLLWGLGSMNAHPTNDVALLRAARRAFGRPDMTLRDLDVLAENWQPARALAARLLWTDLLGPAPG